MLTDIAYNAIIALGLVPDDHVNVGTIINPDSTGKPVIDITVNPAKPEDVTQTGIISVTTPLAIHCVAATRTEAWNVVRQAALAVYQKFTALERQPKSGIYCITFGEYLVAPIQDRTEFHAHVAFNILHK